ncbi:MAG: radical SAM protein [Motiliproteus sp.]|nr:radical SAM protein [Motiliproteus sp.]MCW9053938.1 radical SAM protein [Motiliproteus sp.]
MAKQTPVEVDLSYSSHSRLSEYERLVYPVVSRRSRGLSLGINLNPDKRCNFDCVYCQVDRTSTPERIRPSVSQIEQELEYWLQELEQGQYQGYQLQDIALAGDGEPTSEKQLPQVLELLMSLKQRHPVLEQIKLILFTNGSGIGRNDLADIFPRFFAARGEVWFKLDAWDQDSQDRINRSRLKFDQLIEKLRHFGQRYPVVLQSCFFRWQGQAYSDQLYQPYLELVAGLAVSQVCVDRIQAYTLARKPAESDATPWSNIEMDRLATLLREHLELPVELFYESGSESDG